MSVLRVFLPWECDEHGVPLDWERCRTCDGTGRVRDPRYWGTMPGSTPCPDCGGHGSLRAAAMAKAIECAWNRAQGYPFHIGAPKPVPADHIARCEDCGHPMSEGTWEGGIQPDNPLIPKIEADVVAALRAGRPDAPAVTWEPVHYSPCDGLCDHDGPGRMPFGDGWIGCNALMNNVGITKCFQASWRPVDVRLLSWPHDLRLEHLRVLCLRCWAESRCCDEHEGGT